MHKEGILLPDWQRHFRVFMTIPREHYLFSHNRSHCLCLWSHISHMFCLVLVQEFPMIKELPKFKGKMVSFFGILILALILYNSCVSILYPANIQAF